MTSIRHKLLLTIAICNYLIYRHVVLVQAACDANAINMDDWIRRGLALDGAVFWNGKLDDITKCAVACIRRKVCRSFNYNLVSNMCELNVAVEGERPFRRGTNGLLYSEIDPWLSQFDPSCAGRPCTANEVCLPGQLAQSTPGSGDCSYFCMESSMLCPKPYDQFSGIRKVGVVHNFTCERGEVGGDSAECLVTLQWSKVINTYCALVFEHACTASDTFCDDIDGVCTDGKCQCSAGYKYDSAAKLCTLACGTIGFYSNAQVDPDTGPVRSFTCDAKYVALVPEITCVVDAVTNLGAWEPAVAAGICTVVYKHACSSDTICQSIGAVCTNGKCECPDGHRIGTVGIQCIFACADPPNGYNNIQSFDGTGVTRTFTCDVKYAPVVTEIRCEVDVWTPNGAWKPTPEICTDMYGSDCTSDAECSDIAGVCDPATNKCNCASDAYYSRTQKLCINKFRLVQGSGGNGGDRGDGVTSGLLKIYENGAWGHVCKEEWSWQATNAVCRDLDPSYVYGGVYHHKKAFGPGSDDVTWKYNNLACPTSATSFTQCTYDQVDDCDDVNKAIGITCYQSDITNHIRLNTTYHNGEDFRLEVFYDGKWGTVCEHDWDGTDAGIACKTMNPSQPKKDHQCTNSCAGGPQGNYQVSGVSCHGSETHFFYCRNDGWAIPSYDCPDKQVGLSCKAN